MIQYVRIVLLALTILSAGSAAAYAQAVPEDQPTIDAALALDVATQATGETSSGLPAQSTPPRTLRAHWHVYLAFAATWLLLFGYAVWLGRRFGRLEEEIRQVRNV